MSDLDLSADTITLLEQLVNIESVSRNEQRIADAVEAALRPLAHLDGVAARQHGGGADLARAARAGRRSPATSTPCRSTTTCRPCATATCCAAWAPAT